MTAFLLTRLKLLQLKNIQVAFWEKHITDQPVNLGLRNRGQSGGIALRESPARVRPV